MYDSDFQIFSAKQIESLRKGGKILSECLALMTEMATEGITTKELDESAEAFIRDRGGIPGFKGYRGYPATLCTSINEQCVHGIPNDRPLQNGDIISIDCGVLYDHLYTDACRTVIIGNPPPLAQNLLTTTLRALETGISTVKEGIRLGDLSATIQKVVEDGGCTVVRALTGHGLGSTLHQFPTIENAGKAGKGPIIPRHTLLAIEPIVCAGKDGIEVGKDGWTITMKDGSLAAQCEHTVLVTEDGCEILA
jgi:methionyl aminopeptidase